MLKGELSASPLAEVLQPLADGAATGCVRLLDPAGAAAKVFLRSGRVYAVVAPGERPGLGATLVERGDLSTEALNDALEAQEDELQGWRLSELLVHLGLVEQPVVEAAVLEQVRGALAELLPWGAGTWRFRVNERTRDDVAPPTDLAELLASVPKRTSWSSLLPLLLGPEAVPTLSAAGTASDELSIDAQAWALLCKVDGERSIVELARESDATLYDAGLQIASLVDAGLLEVALPAADDSDEGSDQAPVESFVPASVAARLAGALSGRTHTYEMDDVSGDAPRLLEHAQDEQDLDGSLSRISHTLSAMLGPATAGDDMFSAPVRRAPKPAESEAVDEHTAEQRRRDATRREGDSAELASAQAELETARAAERAHEEIVESVAELDAGQDAEVVDLQGVRDAQAEAARVAAEAAATAEAEAEAAEQTRLEQERATAEVAEQARLDAQAEAEAAEQARLQQEQAEAEAAEQVRLEQERADAAAEAAEQARLERERAEAEAAAQAAIDDEHAQAEAAEFARLAHEQAEAETQALEQARLHQEQAQAAEQARLEQERASQELLASRGSVAAEFAALTADVEPAAGSPSDHAAAMAELSAAANLDVSASGSVPAPVATEEPAAAPVDEPSTWPEEPTRIYANRDADTASLLRELSSLGLDEDAPPVPVARPSRPPAPRAPTTAAQKKRKGLFGRS